MRAAKILLVTSLVLASGAPVFAQDAKGSMMMMESGEVVSIMPDGHMGTMKMTDEAMMGKMMEMSKPLDHCAMFLTDKDGKVFTIDTSTPEAQAECEKMAM